MYVCLHLQFKHVIDQRLEHPLMNHALARDKMSQDKRRCFPALDSAPIFHVFFRIFAEWRRSLGRALNTIMVFLRICQIYRSIRMATLSGGRSVRPVGRFLKGVGGGWFGEVGSNFIKVLSAGDKCGPISRDAQPGDRSPWTGHRTVFA